MQVFLRYSYARILDFCYITHISIRHPKPHGGGNPMQTKLNPYLNFRDSARQAMEFYRSVFGGKLDIRTFKEFRASRNPDEDDKIMHSVLEAENGITFMAADTSEGMEYRPGTNMNMLLRGDNEKELTQYFHTLSAGGTIRQPLAKTPWGDRFGMLTDKFGVEWIVNITGKKTS